MLLHLVTIWALVCAALAHPGKNHGGHHGHGDDDDDESGVCGYHPHTTAPPPSTTSLAASCTFTGTQTFYSSSGCNGLTCETGFCIIDAAATKSCGCDRVVIVTKTTTICPTKTPCYQCTTGWGTFIETQSCTSTAPPTLET